MAQKSKTPAATGALRNSFEGTFRDALTLNTIRTQHLIATHHVRPEIAVMVASIAFGGGYHG